MKVILIIVGVIVVACIARALIGHIVAKRDKACFDKMTLDEQRKAQEAAYKRQVYSNS